MTTQLLDQQTRTNGHPAGAMGGELTFRPSLTARVFTRVSWWWRLRNLPNRLRAVPALLVARTVGRLVGLVWMESELRARLFQPDGTVIDYGVVSRRVVTTVGVGFLVDAFQNLVELELMKYQASGTGIVAEAVGDTALGAEATTITDRATGSQTEGASANIYKSVATQTYTGTAAITEHGLLSVVTEGAGVLWDRSVFAALNVENLSAIEWTYQLTCNAGG